MKLRKKKNENPKDETAIFEEVGSRYEIVEYGYMGKYVYYRVFYDTETKVMYSYVSIYGGESGGLSVMLNADGMPMLYEGEEK